MTNIELIKQLIDRLKDEDYNKLMSELDNRDTKVKSAESRNRDLRKQVAARIVKENFNNSNTVSSEKAEKKKQIQEKLERAKKIKQVQEKIEQAKKKKQIQERIISNMRKLK